MTDCVFCRIARGEIPAKLVHQDDRIVAFVDLNPAAPTHVLVVPRSHIATLDDSSSADDALLGNMMGVARNLARQLGLVKGGYRLVLNVGSGAGQSVFHIHLHLLGGRGLTWPPG